MAAAVMVALQRHGGGSEMRGGAADKAAIQLVEVQPCQLLMSDT